MPEETQDPQQPTNTPRVWDDAYQLDVATRIRAIRDELLNVDGTATVRRDLDSSLRGLPA